MIVEREALKRICAVSLMGLSAIAVLWYVNASLAGWAARVANTVFRTRVDYEQLARDQGLAQLYLGVAVSLQFVAAWLLRFPERGMRLKNLYIVRLFLSVGCTLCFIWLLGLAARVVDSLIGE